MPVVISKTRKAGQGEKQDRGLAQIPAVGSSDQPPALSSEHAASLPIPSLSLTLLSQLRRALSRAVPSHKGYLRCWVQPFRKLYAHQAVMAVMCKERCYYDCETPSGLPDGFQVEHQDHNPAHNCPENLILLSASLHSALSNATRWSPAGREIARLTEILGDRQLAKQVLRDREAESECPF